MNLKRISAIVLALSMTASVAAFAAEENPDVVVDESIVRDVNHDQGDISLLAAPMGGALGGGLGGLMIPIATAKNYATTITINGQALEEYTYEKESSGYGSETITVALTDLPSVPAGYVPMRAIAQADGGYAQWFKDSNTARLYMGDSSIAIVVSFADMSVKVDGELLEGVEAKLLNGTTFLPVSIFDSLGEGFSWVDNSADGVESYEIKTLNGTPLRVLANQVHESANMGGMKTSMEELILYYGEEFGFNGEMMADCIAYLPVSTNADTLILAKLTDESKREEIKAAFEAYQASQLERCQWGYLQASLPAIENAQIVFEGDWALFLICDGAEDGVAQFRASVQAMAE